MVMEFWSGWFDHWGEKHHILDVEGKPKEYVPSFVLQSNFAYPWCAQAKAVIDNKNR